MSDHNAARVIRMRNPDGCDCAGLARRRDSTVSLP